VILLFRVGCLSYTLENEIILSRKTLLVIISGLLTIVLLFTFPREKFSKVFLTIELIVISFRVSSLLSFYIYFEISILPVVLLTLDWDYQPEWVREIFFIFFYILFGCLPLLLMILTSGYQLRAIRLIDDSRRKFMPFPMWLNQNYQGCQPINAD